MGAPRQAVDQLFRLNPDMTLCHGGQETTSNEPKELGAAQQDFNVMAQAFMASLESHYGNQMGEAAAEKLLSNKENVHGAVLAMHHPDQYMDAAGLVRNKDTHAVVNPSRSTVNTERQWAF